MKQAEYKGEIYSIETVYVYDEYISIYKGNLLEAEAIKVPLGEVKILPMHNVSEILISVIDALQDVCIEQGARELSGTDWAKQKIEELQKVKDKVISSR